MKYGTPDPHKFTKVKARRCTKLDFCKGKPCTEELEEYFDAWKGFSIVCPVLDENFPAFQSLGDPSEMEQKMMVFNVKKCYDVPDQPDPSGLLCEEDDVLNPWLSKIAVEAWTIYEKLYFDKRFEKPVFHTMQLLS